MLPFAAIRGCRQGFTALDPGIIMMPTGMVLTCYCQTQNVKKLCSPYARLLCKLTALPWQPHKLHLAPADLVTRLIALRTDAQSTARNKRQSTDRTKTPFTTIADAATPLVMVGVRGSSGNTMSNTSAACVLYSRQAQLCAAMLPTARCLKGWNIASSSITPPKAVASSKHWAVAPMVHPNTPIARTTHVYTHTQGQRRDDKQQGMLVWLAMFC